jgi:L-lactate dehydrogenase complex protein LldG
MEPRTLPPNARAEILAGIRRALSQTALAEVEADIQCAWSAVPRSYRRGTNASRIQTLGLLVDRLRDYDAQVLRAVPADVTTGIAAMLSARGVNRILVPSGFAEDLLPSGFTYVLDEALPPSALDACDGVITTCTLAIAETGTIVLQNAPGQGRRAASLVPDYHLCLIDSAQVVATVPEAFSELQMVAIRPTTFISGPSATADIEMTRIKGVHGPRFLDVLLIDAEAAEIP